MLEALFNDITGKLMVAKFNNTTLDTFHDTILVFLTSTLLQDMLNDIVAKLVFSQSLNI